MKRPKKACLPRPPRTRTSGSAVLGRVDIWYNKQYQSFMKKDFEKWHKKKTDIDNSSKRLFFHEREVWFCSIGMNIGYEQDGAAMILFVPL